MDDGLNRPNKLAEDDGSASPGPPIVEYDYLGTGRMVRTDYPEPDLRLDRWGGTSDAYAGLDRFGRVVDHHWRDYGWNPADPVRVKHGYDRAGNRLHRENTVADSHGGGEDKLYAYDGLDRLTDSDRGDLNAAKDAISSLGFAQQWGLDPLGNWSDFDEDADGDSTWDLDQAREHNKANEIADTSGDGDAITESAGSSWADPAHDRAGSMTTIPKPGDPTATYSATYDAWNRLVTLVDDSTSNTVAEYEYDGLKRRVVTRTYSSGTLDETRHSYYSAQWQVLEQRTGTSPETADAERQFVWGVTYVDALVQRQRDTNADGTLDETLYALADANFNVLALAGTTGSVTERYRYTAYGQVTVLDADFSTDADGASDVDQRILYAGYRFDTHSGLYHVRNRSYHPTLGRWVQRDPAGYVDGLNLYQYVLSDPLVFRDPWGMWSEKACQEFFGPGDNWNAIAIKRVRMENALREARSILNSVSRGTKDYKKAQSLLRAAEEAYCDSLDAYRFWRYMFFYGCECCEGLRNSVHNAVVHADWQDGLEKGKWMSKALKKISKYLRKTSGKALPYGDVTQAIYSYEAFREAVKELTMGGALNHARLYGKLYEDCPEIPSGVSNWHEAVDDHGNPKQERREPEL